MSCYRTYPFPDSKWFLAMGVRSFTNDPFNHFKAMLNISMKHYLQRMLQFNLTAIHPKT